MDYGLKKKQHTTTTKKKNKTFFMDKNQNETLKTSDAAISATFQ